MGQNLIDLLDIEIISAGSENCEAKMLLSDFHAQPFGFLNGGCSLAFAEILAGFCSNAFICGSKFSNLKLNIANAFLQNNNKMLAVAQSVNANHIRPIKSVGELTAFANLIHAGKKTHIWEIKLSSQKKLVSNVIVTNAIIEY